MRDIIDFLKQVEANNNREWFGAHKNEYIECKAKFDNFAAKLIEGIRDFDPSIGPLAVKDCTYRIYRDIRFSADKSPYKTHMGVFIAPGGKKSGFSGYYFQIGSSESGYPGGCMLATGDYCTPSDILKMLREDISFDEGKEFQEALDAAPDFTLDWENALKRVPAGYPADEPYSQWMRLRNFCLLHDTGHKYMTAPNLLERTLEDFKTTRKFLDFINRPVAFKKEM